MKGLCSPEQATFNLNQSSKLKHFRNEFGKTESVSMNDVKAGAEGHISEDVLNEMEVRSRSRLSAYGEPEIQESGIGSKSSTMSYLTPHNHISTSRLSESLHSFSYAAPPNRNPLLGSPSPQANKSFNTSWQFFNFIGADDNETAFNGANRKPSEAIFTIDAKTSCILIANQTACRLFGYKEEELCGGMKINNLFTMEDGIRQEIFIEENIDNDGNVVMVSGKVLEAVDIEGNIIVVSVWMKRIKCGKDPRCVVIMEPVEVSKGSFLFNAEGVIEDCDFFFAFLHGYEEPRSVVGLHIHKLVPALILPTPGKPLSKEVKKQRATSRTKDTIPFPTTIKIKEHDPDFHQLYLERTPPSKQQASKFLYKGLMWVFANISGLVSLSADGIISSCNANFLRSFLGYAESELLGKSITMVIPHFYEQIDLLCDDILRIPSRNSLVNPTDNNRRSSSSPEYETSTASSRINIFNDRRDTRNDKTLSEGDSMESVSTIEELDKNEPEKQISGDVDRETELKTQEAIHMSDKESIDTASFLKLVTDYSGDKEINFDGQPPVEQNLQALQNDSEIRNMHKNKETISDYLKTSTPDSIINDTVFDSPMQIIPSCNALDKAGVNMSHLDGFSPHFESSTPKQDEQKKEKSLSRDLNKSPGRQRLNFNDQTDMLQENNIEKHQCEQKQERSPGDGKSNSLNGKSDPPDGTSDTDSVTSDKELVVTETDPLDKYFSSIEHSCSASANKEDEFPMMSEEDVLADTEENRHINYADTPLLKKPYRKTIPLSDYESLGASLNELKLDDQEPGHPRPKTSDYESYISNLSTFKQQNANTSPLIDLNLDLKDTHHAKHERRFAWNQEEKTQKIVQGHYYGQAKHKDTSMLPILFEVKKLSTKDQKDLFCLWISRDPDEEGEYLSRPEHQLLAASYNTTLNASSGNNFQELLKSLKDKTAEDPGRGPYNDYYVSLKCIGKGAFGFVNLSERKSNKEQVIVKFIRKEKVLKDSWVTDSEMGKVPFEIFILSEIQHPNIVKMLEAYENEDFFQMVMEKHGDGIDLFEFIDRKPNMDEALASYMFRQVIKATDYLHEQKILHRDIKDENIIVDRQFNLKLIDFGSATYIVKGKLFNTFCGTVEYCSPEVLLGNWYEGLELEMWSLGVTLYTFIFGEHPFFEVEETIRAEIFPPFKVSNELMFVICWMLHPEVEFRAKLTDVLTYPWFSRSVDIKEYNYDAVLGGPDTSRSASKMSNKDKPQPQPDNVHPNTQEHSYNISCSPSSSSSSSSSISSSSETSSDFASIDSELDRNNELLKEEYQRYLNDQNDTRTNVMLSKSF